MATTKTTKATTKATTAEKSAVITINRPHISTATITIVGDKPLLVHAWSEKAKKQMLEAQQKVGKAKAAKEIRDPFREFLDAAYWITDKPVENTPEGFEEAIAKGAKFGFPTIAIKKAALAACYRAGIIDKQTVMRCSFFINAVGGVNMGTGSELAIIETDEPPMLREDMVKINMGKSADLRYRPVFNNWKIRLKVSLIETGVFTMQSIINAIELGGLMNGIGEWRMEKDGEFGMYHVEVEG